jgi:hypothetical protein
LSASVDVANFPILPRKGDIIDHSKLIQPHLAQLYWFNLIHVKVVLSGLLLSIVIIFIFFFVRLLLLLAFVSASHHGAVFVC